MAAADNELPSGARASGAPILEPFEVEAGHAAPLHPARTTARSISLSGAVTNYIGSPIQAEGDVHSKVNYTFTLPLCGFVWMAFLVAAMLKHPGAAWPWLVFTALCALYLSDVFQHLRIVVDKIPSIAENVVWGAIGIGIVVVVAIQIIKDANKLQPLFGGLVFLACSAAASSSFRDIPWWLVLKGLMMQFLLGIIVLKTEVGFHFFKSFGDYVSAFLAASDKGAGFVFGDFPPVETMIGQKPPFELHFFAFKVLPTVVFFSAFVSAMYYVGVLQVVVRIIATSLRRLLGSSAMESTNAAGNIFLGQTEAPLLIKPFLATATASEIHAVMVGGFASVAGGVLAAYISFGINPQELIGASIMSAPACLVVAKLIVPETEHPHADSSEKISAEEEEIVFPPPSEINVIEAAGNGASTAIGLVANIAAMLIAFISIVFVVDQLLGYFGGLVDYPDLSFELISGYVFAPVAWLCGVPWAEATLVGKLFGKKVFVNEFVAYLDLAGLIGRKQISPIAEQAATYALCGFANFGSIGIQLGGLTAMCPERRSDISKLVFSAMVAGHITCCLTACVAGILA